MALHRLRQHRLLLLLRFPFLLPSPTLFLHGSAAAPGELHRPLVQPGNVTSLAALLRRYGKAKSLCNGRRLHACIRKCGLDRTTFLGNTLVEMYANCGSVHEARAAYDNIQDPNLYSRNMLIRAYGQNGILDDARITFDRVDQKDVVSWNIMIAAYAQNGHGKDALSLYDEMKGEGFKPDRITYLCALDACTRLANLKKGEEIHADVIDMGYDQDVAVGTALLNMYGKCGSLHDARGVFHNLPHRDVISWNAMISVSSQNGEGEKAVYFFRCMQLEGVEPNMVSFLGIVDACACLVASDEGRDIHAAIVRSGYEQDVVVGTALVNMYGKCGRLNDAIGVFEKMRHRNFVSWNAMIAVFAQNMHGKEALDLFFRMQLESIKPDKVTFISVLDACASLAALEEGQDIHVAIAEGGYEQDIVVGNALINMYGKCGSLCEARKVFAKMQYRDVRSWTAMIAGFAQNGIDKEALNHFHLMQLEGFKPDQVTVVCALIACGRAGWVDEGSHLFVSMKRDHAMPHTGDHYLCMIDLLGRAGKLDEAEDLIKTMQCEKVAIAWRCLLGSCKIHGDIERGVRAATNCFELDPDIIASYVVLSNMYAVIGLSDNV